MSGALAGGRDGGVFLPCWKIHNEVPTVYNWVPTVYYWVPGAAPSPELLAKKNSRCSSSTRCQAGSALANRTEMPTGSPGRDSRLVAPLWNDTIGRGQESGCHIKTLLYSCIDITIGGNRVWIPLTHGQHSHLSAGGYFLGISTEGRFSKSAGSPPSDVAL